MARKKCMVLAVLGNQQKHVRFEVFTFSLIQFSDSKMTAHLYLSLGEPGFWQV